MLHALQQLWQRPMQWVRRLYDWTLHWAETPYAVPALFVLAFAEASVFPIPPDVLLLALALGQPRRAPWFVLVCTVGSVLGAVGGWAIGAGLWAAMGTDPACPQYAGGAWLFEHVPGFGCEVFGRVQQLYADNAVVALLTAAFTPIPFKVFTIAAGVAHIPLLTLVLTSIVGRGARFLLLGGLVYLFGRQVRGFIERRFEVLTVVFAVLLIGGFFAVKHLL